jgi:hypothetical protein
MSKSSSNSKIKAVVKKTSQGGRSPKTSSMNKVIKASHKAYRGQGR